jgi:hypothetical protein
MGPNYVKPPAKSKVDIRLAANWRISRLRECLKKRDRAGLALFIRERHTERFFQPIAQLGATEGNVPGYGFAMMALCSLLVETLQSYREGLPTTHSGELGTLKNATRVPKEYVIPLTLQVSGRGAFERFFQHFGVQFAPLDGVEFYSNVRNGLLHQAQTKKGWKIGANKGALFSHKTIDRDIFVDRLKQAFDIYLAELGNDNAWNGPLWLNARRKIWWLIRLSK